MVNLPQAACAPIHRADLHIIEPTASELWLDVRIHTVAPNLPVTRELLREEQTKCRSYGQRHGYDLNQLDRGMIPVVLEQGHTPYFKDSFTTARNSLSDKGLLLTPKPKGRPPLSCGSLSLASCSEQPGSRLPSVCLHRPRPDRLNPPRLGRIPTQQGWMTLWPGQSLTQPGWIWCPPGPGLKWTPHHCLSCPPQG